MNVSTFLDDTDPDLLKLDRSNLKDQAVELLREQIVSGRIPQGTRLAERELSKLLGISRMPVRDALMELEREGLVETRSNGRYVIELREEDVRKLFEMRLVLERTAVTLAVQNLSKQNCEALQANLQQMRDAVENNNRTAFERSDLEAHELIWQQAENPYLLKMLNSIVGPTFMFIASHSEFQTTMLDTLQFHESLTNAICAGDLERAVQSIEEQMESSRQLSMYIFSKRS